ncbi:hypothetical protein [Desulfosporosinus sp. FKB]|uniref:hypothetical protein n=1 Tax=Desulfosporosinus sp. FKB TaxID=1969835 RepID=UPI000B4A3CA8|nr:hypothetical protein [Desulfosporosinus sp. FKB]
MKRSVKITSGLLLTVIMIFVVLTAIPNVTHHSTKAIIKKTLESVLVYKQLPDYNLLLDKGNNNIVVSNENIDTNWISQLPGINITVLSPSAIQEKSKKDGEYLYLRFTKVDIGILIATVSLDNTWASPPNGNFGYLSGGRIKLKFYNILGNWVQSPIIESWIS